MDNHKGDTQSVHRHLSNIRAEMVDLAIGCSAKRAQDAVLKFIHASESICSALQSFMNCDSWRTLAGRCRSATLHMRHLRSIVQHKRRRRHGTVPKM